MIFTSIEQTIVIATKMVKHVLTRELKVDLNQKAIDALVKLGTSDKVRIAISPATVGRGSYTLLLTQNQFNNLTNAKNRQDIMVYVTRETLANHVDLLPEPPIGVPKKLDEIDDQTLAKRMEGVNHFLGVFANDALPVDLIDPSVMQSGIANLQNQDQGGSHWVAFLCNPPLRTVEYFDPFGAPPNREMLDFLERYGYAVVVLQRQIQDITSDACGYYCELYIKARVKGRTLYEIIFEIFKKSPENNEDILSQKLAEFTF
jgi:hypothetical protein